MSRPETTRPPSLTSLKVVVKHDMPSDELWVHPAMYDVLQRAFMEADAMRGFRQTGDIQIYQGQLR